MPARSIAGLQDDRGGTSIGHACGRRIVAILQKKQADYTDAVLAHMRKMTGYVHRHLAQRPDGAVTETPWRRSPIHWRHDPERR